MTFSQLSGLGRAILIATAALALAAPVASAGRPDRPDQAADNADQAAGNADHAADNADRAADNAAPPAGEEKAAADEPAATSPCDSRVFSRVFTPWHDRALYTLAPAGDFETLAEGWTLEGPATVAADSSPFLLGAALGVGSLELQAGATAVSPPICVQRGFTNFRFLGRSVSTDAGVVKVQVLYAHGKTKKAGRFSPAAEWAPTRKISLAQGLFRTRRRGSALIQLRFAAVTGAVRVDDVYVDPRYHR